MDQIGFKTWLLPLVTHLLSVLGKYIIPPIMALTEAAAGGGRQLVDRHGGAGRCRHRRRLTSWLTKKAIITKSAAITDAKIAENDKP